MTAGNLYSFHKNYAEDGKTLLYTDVTCGSDKYTFAIISKSREQNMFLSRFPIMIGLLFSEAYAGKIIENGETLNWWICRW